MGSVCWLAMSIYILPHSFMLLHYDVHYLCLHKHPQDTPTCTHTNKEHHQRHTDAYGDAHTCSYVPALCACVSLHAWHYACGCAYSMCIVDVSHARVTLLVHNTMEGKAAINQSIHQPLDIISYAGGCPPTMLYTQRQLIRLFSAHVHVIA